MQEVEFRYVWTTEKYTCPECGYKGKYQRYIDRLTDELLPEKYGRCERINSCCYDCKPAPLLLNNEQAENSNYQSITNHDIYSIDDEMCTNLYNNEYLKYLHNRNNLDSMFIDNICRLFGSEIVLKTKEEYGIAITYDNSLIYPYFFNGFLINGKIISYLADFHRANHPQWLSNYNFYGIYEFVDGKERNVYKESEYNDSGYRGCLPLFGWDLIAKYPDKKVCVVEAEKTAFICSILMPQYVWVATGQKQLLKPYKFPYNTHRDYYIFPDMDGNLDNSYYTDYWTEQAEIVAYNCPPFKHKVIDYTPNYLNDMGLGNGLRMSGSDIADIFLKMSSNKSILGKYIQQIITQIEE